MEAMTGENGIVLVNISGTTLTEIPGLTEIDVDSSRDYYDSTVMGDVSKSAVPGRPDFTGTVGGDVDSTDDMVYTICDGIAHTATIKLDRSAASTSSHQWRGKMFFDIKTKSPNAGITTYEVTVKAQTPGVTKYFADS